ncbi:DNA topoisomerase 3-alpha [Glycine soja]|uniref:DNA topoisomerase n=1 Tax=Glycine soja TaxID=3848 RepID=A0A445KA77_GLYSO|nr:DNA topoisomerase 3-alpha [Glycine soja]
MNVLNVAEKPMVARTVATILSRNQNMRMREGRSRYNKIFEFNYTIRGQPCHMIFTSVTGHLMELEFDDRYRKWHSCDPADLFRAPVHKFVPEDKKDIKRTLEEEARRCQWLILWLDCDVEGENIAYEVIDVCTAVNPHLTIKRAWFSTLIDRDIHNAAQNDLRDPDKRVADAVDVRQEIDLRIGASFTRFQTMLMKDAFIIDTATDDRNRVLSYGPCQFPTLGFVVERFWEIQAHEPEEFWSIICSHESKEGTAEFSWMRGRLFDYTCAVIIYEMCVEEPTATPFYTLHFTGESASFSGQPPLFWWLPSLWPTFWPTNPPSRAPAADLPDAVEGVPLTSGVLSHVFPRCCQEVLQCLPQFSGCNLYVTNIRQQEKPKYPPFPLNTIELQKRASRYFRMSSDHTMKCLLPTNPPILPELDSISTSYLPFQSVLKNPTLMLHSMPPKRRALGLLVSGCFCYNEEKGKIKMRFENTGFREISCALMCNPFDAPNNTFCRCLVACVASFLAALPAMILPLTCDPTPGVSPTSMHPCGSTSPGMVAEELYQAGFISYPRTETDSFSPGTDLHTIVQEQQGHPEWGIYAQRLMDPEAGLWRNPRGGGHDDKAHPPIYPTKFSTGESGWSQDHRKLYELVVRHFLACVSKPALGAETTVEINIAGELFSACGRVILEKNYLDVYRYESWGGSMIPTYTNGQQFNPTKLTLESGVTRPPPLLSEADLLSYMDREEAKIGTDATMQDHIKKMLDRSYATKDSSTRFTPTNLGEALVLGYDDIDMT